MEPLPIDLPPGVWKNGTRYQARGRWFETNRVRWHDGAMRQIGGWQRRVVNQIDYPPATDGVTAFIRDQHVWRDVDKNLYHVLGDATKVQWMQSTGIYEDISPVNLPPGPLNPATNVGYGSGPYGREPYGVARTAEGIDESPVGRWRFDNWGDDLLAMPDWTAFNDPNVPRTIYTWDGTTGTDLVQLTNAPVGIEDFVVTENRIVMAIGDATDLRRVRWCDQENNTDWTPTDANQADFRTLDGAGKMIAIYNVGKQVLVLTETDAQVARYVGPPYVYRFDRVGKNCAPVHRNAVAVTNEFAVWVGERNFWIYEGGQLSKLDCDLIDFVVEDAAASFLSKVFTWINADFTEIWWHYVGSGAGADQEPNKYVMWDWTTKEWAHGDLDRTSIFGSAILSSPQGFDNDGIPYWHELTSVFVEDAYAITGPLELGEGGKNLAIQRVWPDTELFADVDIQFDARQFPTGAVVQSPVYAFANPTPVRIMGRDIGMRVNGKRAGWELGRFRIEYAPVGTGKR